MPDPRLLPVLIVDDTPMIVASVRAVLGQLGFRDVDAVEDGAAGLTRMRRRRYGLVIADWNVPPTTGYDLLQRIRKDQDLGATPFVMMSNQEQAHCFPAARRAGANACLIKPFGVAELRSTVKSIDAGSVGLPR